MNIYLRLGLQIRDFRTSDHLPLVCNHLPQCSKHQVAELSAMQTTKAPLHIMSWYSKWGVCALLHHAIQNSMEAILVCRPALSTERLGSAWPCHLVLYMVCAWTFPGNFDGKEILDICPYHLDLRFDFQCLRIGATAIRVCSANLY